MMVLIEVYKEESKTTMKKTSFNYSPLFMTSFVKQKVCLALNTFNEKTSAELLWRGKMDAAVAQF